MKTHQQMLERLKWYVGRYIDFDGAYQAQCMDLVVDFIWWATDGKYRMWGNAIDAVNDRVNNYGKYATVHKNTKDFLPQVGDIAVWTKPPAHEVYGHIGIVYGNITLDTCTMLDQNWDGDPSRPAKLRTDDYKGVTHFIRINFEGEPAPTPPKNDKTAVIVDISQFQPVNAINYDIFAEQVDHVIIRTMDADYEDTAYKEHHKQLQARGIPTAAYAFVRGQNDTHMVNEAKMFYDRMKGIDITFWWLDVETVSHPNMRHGVSVYINELRRLGAKKIGLYIAHHLYKQLNLDTSEADAVWIPHYGSGSATADSKPDFPADIHQYTEHGRLPGYNGNLDLNRLIGNKNLEYFTNGKVPVNKPSSSKPSTKYPKATMGTFRKNHLGIQWAPATGVWINGNQPIEKRHGSPWRLKNNSAGMMKAGQRLDYREIARSDGHIWLLDYKSDQWVPVKTWNSVTGAVGADWGSWK